MSRKFPEYNELTTPKMIVCEGPSDRAFIRQIISTFRLPEVCVRYTSTTGHGPGGIDRFGSFLTGVRSFKGFYDLTDILLIADNDISPQENFQKIVAQINSVKDDVIPRVKFVAPSQPMENVGTNPSITVMMIPFTGVSGNLETLCLKAAMESSPDISVAVNQFAESTQVESWPEITLKSKMKLRSILAAAHKKDPFIGLSALWCERPELIPVTHESLKDVVDAVSKFCAA